MLPAIPLCWNDDQRLPSQAILDLGLGRKFPVGDRVSLNIDLQLFNLFNEDANEFWDGSDYARGTPTATNRILPRSTRSAIARIFAASVAKAPRGV